MKFYRCFRCHKVRNTTDRPEQILSIHAGNLDVKFCPNCTETVGVANLTINFFNSKEALK